MREGDIESIRRAAIDRGRPIKSNVIIGEGGNKTHYRVDRNRSGKERIIIIGTE